MSTSTAQCALFLAPRLQNFTVEDASQLALQLNQIGLIAQPLTSLENAFYTGERFFDYVSYMGCSPAIKFETDAQNNGEDFCHIKIHHYDYPQLIISRLQSRAPHCPHCSKPVKNWLNNNSDENIYCDRCRTSSNMSNFDWRKMAGFARLFIEITDIYPKEAIPQQILLDKLTGLYKTDWHYFYACR